MSAYAILSIRELMQRFNAADLASVAALLEGAALVLGIGEDKPIDEQTRSQIRTELEDARKTLRTLGLTFCVLQIGRMLVTLDSPDLRPGELKAGFDELDNRLDDELDRRSFFVLPENKDAYFSPKEPLWGPDFQAGFQSGALDLDEAAKCFALGRYTATAFHAMRVAEIGVRAIARSLGIPDPIKPAQRNWGDVLRVIKGEIDQRWPAAQRMSGDGHVFEALYASLDAMKNPWRNATMHVEATYAEEDARAIFDAVGAFMRRVAARMDENGSPLA